MDRLGIGFIRGLAPTEVVDAIQQAESAGFDSAWVAEGHGGDHFALLSAAAMATERIALGTAVTSVYVRSAPTIAMAAATVDALAAGRFRLGLGSSHRVQVVGEHGLAYGQPIEQVRETIEIARRVWTDSTATYAGPRIPIEGFDLWFEPLHREIPIYVGALNPKMLQLTGELADGVILTRATLGHVRSANDEITVAAEQAGRDPAAIDRAVLIPCALDDDIAAARDVLRPGFAMYAARFPRYRALMERAGFESEVAAARAAWDEEGPVAAGAKLPDDLIDAMALAGPADRIRAGLARYREAGATLPILSFAASEPTAADQARRLIDALAPPVGD